MTFDPDKYLEDRGISLDEGANETSFDPDTWLKQKSELQASTLDTYDNAITDTPEQIARFKGLSEKTGVPYETAKLIPDQVESIANKPNWKMINEDSPKTAAWLARDPRNLGLTRSELKRLQAIEKGRTSGETAQDYAVSLTQGFSVAGASIFGSMDLAREALIPDTTEAVLLHLGKMLTGYAPDDMGVVSNMARTGVDFKEATSASQFLKSDYSKAQKAEVDRKFDEGFWSGVKSMVVDNPNQAGEMVVESLPLMASLVGAVRVKAAQVFNGTYQRAIAQGLGETQAKLLGQKAVEKMVPELAKFGAMVEGAQQAGSSAADYAADGDITGKEATGAIGSGITTMLASRFSNFLGDKVGVKDLESSLASIGIDSPKATSAAAIGGRMIGGAVKEGPIEEGLQSLTEGMWSNYVEGRPIFDNAEKNFAQGSVLGIATNTGISVLTEGTNAYRHHQIKKFQAEHQAEKILGEIKTISESKLMQTSPQTWREYMDSIDGYIEHVYINPNDLVESGMDVETFLQSVPTAAAEIRRAIETNSFVTIPKNELIVGLSSIPDADFVAGIVSHLRTEQQKESLAELNKKQETLLEDLQGEVERNLQDREKLQEFREKQKQIETSLMETMLSTGFDRKNAKPQAQLVSSFYTVMAGRAGVDPVEYFESNFGRVINAEHRTAVEDALTGSDLLNQRHKVKEVEGRWRKALRNSGSYDFPPHFETPSVLKIMGEANKKLSISRIVIQKILSKHKDVPLVLVTKLPSLLMDPEFIYPHKDGGVNVVINATTDSGEPIVVGVRDGKIKTITPKHDNQDLKGRARLLKEINAAIEKDGGNVYARNKKALAEAKALNLEGVGNNRHVFYNRSLKMVTLRDDVVKKVGSDEYYHSEGVIRGTFNPSTLDITLLKDANLSTFLHEAGHLFLELTFDLSTRDGASDSLRQDVAKILDWFGLESLDEWASLSFEEKRVFHEKWAESFEQYLMEGRAPSTELQSAFRTFKRWMIQIYKSLKAFLASNENADLTDEVRQVFDRMLASEQQIKSLMIAQGRMPVFDVKPDGMTDEEWEEYQQQYLKTEEEAIEALTARMLRDMEWLRKNRRSEIKRKIEEEVRAQVMSEGIYRVWAWLTKTTPTDGGSFIRGTPDQKLDITALTDQLGEENKDLVDRLRSRGMASQKGTQDANEVADRFGYESALQMAVELDQMILPDEIIRQRTEEEMIKRHADIPTWQDLEAAADELIHRKAHSRFLATELARMKAAYGKPSLVTKAAKQYADQLVSALKINELKVSMYQASETREGKKADKFWKQGNHSEAAMAKRNQLLHHNTVAEIQQAKKEVSKGLKHIRKLNSKNGQKAMRGDNRVQLNRFMARFDFRQSPNAQQQAVNNMSLREFITAEAQRLSMPVPDLSSPIYDEQFRKHYKDMTVEEFRGVMDVIRQLEALARREQQVYTAIKQMTFQQEKASILDTLRKHYPKFFDGEDKPINPNHSLVPNTSQKFRKLGEGFMAQFLSVETLLNLYDGGELGQMHQSFFKRISDRMEWFHNFSKEVDDYLKPHFDAYSKIEKVQFATKDIGSKTIGISITRNQALGVLLLYGNPEGRQRLSNRWNETTLHQIMGLLDEKDVNLANAIWRTFDNKLWPELEGVNKRTIGMAPPKVQAISFTTNKGHQARGGYFRLKPDNEEVPTYDRFDEEKAINVLMNGVGMSAKTDQSSSQTRIQDLQYKPDLDAMSLLSHTVHETLHDVAYREAVLDTWRLLQDPEIATAMKNIGGKDVYRVIRQRIGEIAVPPVEDRGILENIVSTARRNTVATLLSGIGTAFQNLTGIFPAFLRVHNGLLAREIARSANPLEMKRMYDLMIEKSVYMPNRIKQFDRDMVKDIASMKMGIRSLNPVPDLSVALAAMGWVDRMVTIPVWSAAFAEGMIKYNNDENMAAEYADHIIRQTMGSGRQFDLAKVMTGNAWMKLFTMFHSYFNGQLQLAVREGILSAREVRTNPARAASRLAASVMLLWIIPAILTELSRQAPDDEDDEERIDRVTRAVVLYPTAMFPLLRDVAPYYYDSLFSDRAYSPKMSPAFAGVESVKKGAESAMDEEKDVKDISNMIMGGSFLVGLPGIMLKDFWEGTHAFVTGETNNPVEILVGTPPGR